MRASAFEAGVDPGTAYDHRAKDVRFRAGWDAARAAYGALTEKKRKAQGPLHHAAHGPPPRSGEELILRRSKQGDRLVRAAAGRWCARVEESFLDALEETGCVRTAARSAGMSTQALYARRDKYPEFAARWDERVERFREQLPGLINAAAVETMRPQPEGAKRRGRARLPKLSGADAVRVYAINENAKARGRGRGGESPRRPEQTHEELVQEVATLFRMRRQRLDRDRLGEGWTDAGNGIWVPPGWTPPSPETPAGERDE